ncbi:hypothetical protein SAMN05444673_7038 [Bacillus sp. OV166]|nr:hypothetical protein SAMN05444673_7038 [Bacillus sp. OV166]
MNILSLKSKYTNKKVQDFLKAPLETFISCSPRKNFRTKFF